ncbi:MAG: hypothetical protein HY060_09840 [Proteobacteria bacterium]|nr:hypothetical protein [Pseudomonadota bacterium]
MAASVLDQIKSNITKARSELNARRKDLEHQIAALQKQLDALDADFAMLDRLSGRAPRGRGGPRGPRKLQYGGVRTSVLDAIKGAKGIKPAQIVKHTGLNSPQVHNALTGLKKSKEVKVKDGLYHLA